MAEPDNPAALNFDLLITRAADEFRAYVIDSPGGDADVTFELPFAPEKIGRLVHGGGIRRGLRAGKGGKDASKADLRTAGSQLFDALITDNVRRVYDTSRSDADRSGQQLRVRLRFSDDAAVLATLPWEILFDPEQQQFLALAENRPIVRYLPLPRTRQSLKVETPISILAVLASPKGYDTLDIASEWKAAEGALRDLTTHGKVALETLTPPTLDALRKRLLGNPPVHVLHFVGHGVFNEETDSGSLLFADKDGRGHLVSGRALGDLLHNHSSLRLVYLNACEGAITGRSDVFAGVAQTLVRQGVPAAIAMQDEISDDAAVEMARTFYTALATGRPVDAALTQARLALSTADNNEWAVPVLFSRSPDNHLFDIVDVLPRPKCPYPGMHPFKEEQNDLFFGRDDEITEAINRLAHHPFLVVVGPSGSGKSSLAFAGIIPRLQRSSSFDSNAWEIKVMRPGDRHANADKEEKTNPLATLASLLDVDESSLIDKEQAKSLFAGEHTQTLLFIDQFEELFTLIDANWAKRFLNTLHGLINIPGLTILLTVRADFYPALMATGQFWKAAVRPNRLELTPLDADNLWDAIVQPAETRGVMVEDALAVALIADAGGESGVLPLVQETLVLLWDAVDGRSLGLDAYKALAKDERNALQVAIDRLADHAYDNELAPDKVPGGQRIAHRIFLRLVQFGEGRADTRRRQSMNELRSGDDDEDNDDFVATVKILAKHRLITTSGDESKDASEAQSYVDISHEALIAGWGKLRGWIAGAREAEVARRRLENAANGWLASDKVGGLLDEYELHQAQEWRDSTAGQELGSSELLDQLVEASSRAIKAREEENEAARQREKRQIEAERAARKRELEQTKIAAREAERRQRALKYALGASAIAILFLFGLISMILWQRFQTRGERSLSEALKFQEQVQKDVDLEMVTESAIQAIATVRKAVAADPNLESRQGVSTFITDTLGFAARRLTQDGETLAAAGSQGNARLRFEEAYRLTTIDDRYTVPPEASLYIRIPAGEISLGASPVELAEGLAADDDLPHTAVLDEFWISRTEITNGQYQRCVNAEICSEPENTFWNAHAYKHDPVTHVTHEQAETYAAWAGGRLPTEAEWERACRGVDGRIYPWGNDAPATPLLNHANTLRRVTAVGSYPAGAHGLFDMAGNVHEWTADWYAKDYYQEAPQRNPEGPDGENQENRVIRGGAWNDGDSVVRCAHRGQYDPTRKTHWLGFRVVQ